MLPTREQDTQAFEDIKSGCGRPESMAMVPPKDEWSAQFGQIMEQTCPFQHIFLLFAQLFEEWLFYGSPEDQNSVNGEQILALGPQIGPVRAQDGCQLDINGLKDQSHINFEERTSASAQCEVIGEFQSEFNFFEIGQILDF